MKMFFKSIPAVLIAILFLFNNVQAQTKARPIDSRDSGDSRLYGKVEVEASFPGGPAAWTQYITKQIMQSIDQLRKRDYEHAL